MTKKHSLLIVDRKDPKLKLEQLEGKFCEKISFDSSNHSKNLKSKLDRTIRKLMNKDDPYLAIYLKAEKANANVAVIEEKTGNFFINSSGSQIKEKTECSIVASLYSVPEINPYFPTQLFEGAFNVDYISNKYFLVKSFSHY